jgi:maltooligosyltrehalose trehalohydrolase
MPEASSLVLNQFGVTIVAELRQANRWVAIFLQKKCSKCGTAFAQILVGLDNQLFPRTEVSITAFGKASVEQGYDRQPGDLGMVPRRLPVGAEPLAAGGVHFRVWSLQCKRIEVLIERCGDGKKFSAELNKEVNGYFSGSVLAAKPGDTYLYALDDEKRLLPDPASRFQPDGPLGPSMIIDPGKFHWHDNHWVGVRIKGQVFYEMHIGTFTPEGSWRAASQELAALKDLGVTILEIMPVHDFCGRYGWGYDGVDFFAPTRLYGTPDDFRSFVDQAHALGLGVVLDVVYNHVGPAGNYLKEFSAEYFTDRYSTDWGEALNYDGPHSKPVRQFFVANAGYWIDEFHLDGLRLDATQNIYDRSERHILVEIAERVHRVGERRSTIVIAENEHQETKLLRPVEEGGYGIDAVWNDDFHHSAIVALSGHNEAYYSDYCGKPQEFISAAKWGYLYQGQHYRLQKQRRGTATHGLEHAAFVNYLQNHDQIANFGRGLRIHLLAHPGMYRALTALLLLTPQTPLLFQGQEFAATSPFVFFADHDPELAAKVRAGRLEFLSQFPSSASPQMRPHLPDPTDEAAFRSSKLDLSERKSHSEAYALHRDLLKLRREDPVFNSQRAGGVDGAVLADEIFVLRFFGANGSDRLLLINFGIDHHLSPAPEPLLASPATTSWRVLWSSEDPRYGGSSALPLENMENWFIPGKAAFVLIPSSNGRDRSATQNFTGAESR